MENWQEITEAPGYFISDQGRVLYKNKLVKLSQNPKNYLRLRIKSKGLNLSVHQLVLKAFGPEQPPNTTPDHINRIKTDNRLINLRWATVKEQQENRVLNPNKGSKNHAAKLSEKDITIIRQLLLEGVSQDKIAKRLNVSQCTISRIKLNLAWTHVKDKKP